MKSVWSPMFKLDSDIETIYRTGALAPRSGLYWTSHLRHRLAHVVFVDEGIRFPACRHCGAGVRFHLQLRAHRIESDPSFVAKSKVVSIKSRKPSSRKPEPGQPDALKRSRP